MPFARHLHAIKEAAAAGDHAEVLSLGTWRTWAWMRRPGRLAALRLIGEAALSLGQYRKAAAHLRRAVKLGAHDANTLLQWGRAERLVAHTHETRRGRKAVQRMRMAADLANVLHPGTPHALLLQLPLAIQDGKWSEVQGLATAILELDGENPAVLRARGEACSQLGRLREASLDFDRVFQITSDAEDGFRAALAAFDDGRFEAAVEIFAALEEADQDEIRSKVAHWTAISCLCAEVASYHNGFAERAVQLSKTLQEMERKAEEAETVQRVRFIAASAHDHLTAADREIGVRLTEASRSVLREFTSRTAEDHEPRDADPWLRSNLSADLTRRLAHLNRDIVLAEHWRLIDVFAATIGARTRELRRRLRGWRIRLYALQSMTWFARSLAVLATVDGLLKALLDRGLIAFPAPSVQATVIALLWVAASASSNLTSRFERKMLDHLRVSLRDLIRGYRGFLVLSEGGVCEIERTAPVPHSGRSGGDLVRYSLDPDHPPSQRAAAACLALRHSGRADVEPFLGRLQSALRADSVPSEVRRDLVALAAMVGDPRSLAELSIHLEAAAAEGSDFVLRGLNALRLNGSKQALAALLDMLATFPEDEVLTRMVIDITREWPEDEGAWAFLTALERRIQGAGAVYIPADGIADLPLSQESAERMARLVEDGRIPAIHQPAWIAGLLRSSEREAVEVGRRLLRSCVPEGLGEMLMEHLSSGAGAAALLQEIAGDAGVPDSLRVHAGAALAQVDRLRAIEVIHGLWSGLARRTDHQAGAALARALGDVATPGVAAALESEFGEAPDLMRREQILIALIRAGSHDAVRRLSASTELDEETRLQAFGGRLASAASKEEWDAFRTKLLEMEPHRGYGLLTSIGMIFCNLGTSTDASGPDCIITDELRAIAADEGQTKHVRTGARQALQLIRIATSSRRMGRDEAG